MHLSMDYTYVNRRGFLGPRLWCFFFVWTALSEEDGPNVGRRGVRREDAHAAEGATGRARQPTTCLPYLARSREVVMTPRMGAEKHHIVRLGRTPDTGVGIVCPHLVILDVKQPMQLWRESQRKARKGFGPSDPNLLSTGHLAEDLTLLVCQAFAVVCLEQHLERRECHVFFKSVTDPAHGDDLFQHVQGKLVLHCGPSCRPEFQIFSARDERGAMRDYCIGAWRLCIGYGHEDVAEGLRGWVVFGEGPLIGRLEVPAAPGVNAVESVESPRMLWRFGGREDAFVGHMTFLS